MKVDKVLINQLKNIHQEFPVLTLEEILDIFELINSEDADISSTGQSMIYLSNFFEIPETCKVIIKNITCKKNTDINNLEKIINNLNDQISDFDKNLASQLNNILNDINRK